MIRTRAPGTLVACVLMTVGWAGAAVSGQQAATTQPSTQPTTAPTEHTPLTARVIDVRGDAQHAALESDDWQPCRLDDEYAEQTMIRTGVRSSVKLQIGTDDTYTAVVIEPVSKTLIGEAFRTADTKRVRIDVGYGLIRAGIAEGGLKSDFTVQSPVATLSKRGTWNFGLFYERGTDRFEIFLLEQGLVEAFNRVTGERRELLPGEVVTQTMRRWLDEAQLRRNVAVVDILGQADLEVAFNRLRQDGLRVLDPQGGQAVLIDLSSPVSRQTFADLVRHGLLPTAARPTHGPLLRREGFFGTGRGDELIPVIIDGKSPLAQRGLARPGQYKFPRSVLESWLRQHGKK